MTVNLSKANLFATNLVAEIKAIDLEMEKLKAERDRRVNALIGTAKEASGKFVVDSGSFTVSENNTYDDAAILAALKPGQIRLVQKKVVDKAKVKALYPAVYARAKVRKGFKVTIG